MNQGSASRQALTLRWKGSVPRSNVSQKEALPPGSFSAFATVERVDSLAHQPTGGVP